MSLDVVEAVKPPHTLFSVWYLSCYCNPRLQEIVVVKILMEGIAATAGLYSGKIISINIKSVLYTPLYEFMTQVNTMIFKFYK